MTSPAKIVNDPPAFARKFLKILDKDKNIIPFRWNRAQAHFNANRSGRDLILKARQLGFSTLIQGEMFRRTVTNTRTTITLAHDADATTKLRIMADRFWEHCRFNDTQPARKYANASMTTYPEFDSVATIGTAGNIESGRGGTYSDFHGSEIAFWPEAERIIAGAMQGGSPDVVLESTPNGAQGFFYDKCMEALDGNSNWMLHFYPWWWDDAYRTRLDVDERIELTGEERGLSAKVGLSPEQVKWRRNKQRDLGRFFVQEYPEDPITCFLTSGNGYFGDLTDVFTAPFGAQWMEGHVYVAGLDFAQTVDFTAMPIWDVTVKKQVDLLHVHGLEWSEQRRQIRQKHDYWHLRSILAEWNSIGGPNIEQLQRDGVRINAFKTTNESKAEIVTGMHEAIHVGGWKMLDIPVQRHEMNTFVSTQLPSGAWRYAADGEGHDDTVIGNALALRDARVPIQIFM